MIKNKHSSKAKIPRSIFAYTKPQWYNLWPLWITAVATFLYFIATVGMWFTMKGTLDQTVKQVNIQKDEILNRLRPMVYPSLTDISNQLIVDDVLKIDFKNFGPISANEFKGSVAITNTRFRKLQLAANTGFKGIIPPGNVITLPCEIAKDIFKRETFLYYAIWYKSINDAKKHII
jgi:hypothetical protein